MATVTGTAGDDLLVGSDGAETLLGLGGDDTLLAGAGADSIDGGAGTDRVVIDRSAATGAITLFMLAPALVSTLAGANVTGVEALSFTAGSGSDGLVGGAGADSLAGAAGDDALQGGAGADSLAGGDGADTLLGGAGADVLSGGTGADLFILQGSGGLDSSLAAPDRIQDFNAAEGDRLALRGEAIGAGLLALAGLRFALSGQAALPIGFGGALAPRAAPMGGPGLADPTGGLGLTLYWQPGTAAGGWLLLDLDRDGILGSADLVVRLDLAPGQSITAASFAAGSFATLGTTAADGLAGSPLADSLLGFDGADSLAGLEGDDTLAGGAGADSLTGGAGFDSLLGGEGADTLDGGDSTDVLDGGLGGDLLLGGAGDDLLLGGAGADNLQGGLGDDSLQGGSGADTLAGGAGADTILLQGMGEAAWSSLAAPDLVTGFTPAEGDRLRLSNAWFGNGDGSGADAGTYAGTDGIARALVFSGSTGTALAAPTPGMALPAQGNAQGVLDAYQLYWIPALAGGGWLVLDLDRNARLDATDLLVRLDAVGALAPEEFTAGTFLTLAGGYVVAGTAGDDSLAGGSLGETFLAGTGQDRIAGGAGAGNALSYASFAGPIVVTLAGYAAGTTAKPGGTTDSFTGIQVLAGTAGADTLDAGAATGGLFALSLEGRAGADLLIGNGTTAVQLSYAASPAAISLDLLAGSGSDGWGSTDTLVNIRRVAATSAFGDTVLGSLGDDLFLSGASGNKTFDGRLGSDEWRYAGEGALTVQLNATTSGGFALGPYVLKPGGTDRLSGIEAVTGGAGHDSMLGSAADERFGGGAGNDTLDGGNGYDIADYGSGGLASRGVVVDLAAGTAADQWGGTDVLRNIESAWGSALGDDLTGLAITAYTWLRGQSGNDTLRAPSLGSYIGADYAGDPAGVMVDLGAGSGRDGWGGTDVLVGLGVARGSAFADSLTGGTGADTLFGGPGDDLYQPGSGDILVEAAGEGSDTVVAALSWTLAPEIEVLLLAEAAGAATGIGNDSDNRITGNAAADTLDGRAGDDTILGGAGDDALYGSPGDDLIDGEAGSDALAGGPGADTLRGGEGDDSFLVEADGRFSGTLLLETGEATPRLLLLSAVATFADTVEGGPGTDRWHGIAGPSLLDLRRLPLAMVSVEVVAGSAGADALLLAPGQGAASLEGGDGADTLSGTEAGDRLDGATGDDLLAGQGGDDTLSGGSGDDTLLGGAGADQLFGLAGHNSLAGGAGDDTLEGGGDAEWLGGGPGDDLYRLGRTDTLVFEAAGEGQDTVLASASVYLYPGTEALILAGGAGDLFGLGNALDNRLTGNAGANLLIGLDGADTLEGGGGADTLHGAAGADSLLGEAGADALFAGQGADTLRGGDGADILCGEAGDDSLEGGAGRDGLAGGAGDDTLDGASGAGEQDDLQGGPGDDVFRIDSLADVVLETPGEGIDTIVASIPGAGYILPADVENLVLLGGMPFGVGNAGDNRITGNAAPNRLFGGAGADTLDGQGGADLLFGQAGADTFVVRRGGGADTIGDFTPGLDRLDLASLGFADAAAVLAATTDHGGTSLIDFGQGDQLVLQDVAKTALLAGDFLFG